MELVVDGLRMHYHIQGEGPPVLLLHGLGSSCDDWLLQFPALSGRYTVLALDLRGHGRTDKPRGPYTIEQMARDVAGLLAALEVGPVHVVGLSLGGLVAQVLAADHSERVRSLVLVNTFACLRPRSLRSLVLMARRAVALLTGGLEQQAEVVATALFPRPEQAELRQLAAERLRANDPAAYRATMRAALRFDGRDRLARIRVPTLVVAGADDTTVPLGVKRELAAAIPGAELVVIPNSGHATPVDQPDAFNRLLLDFWQSRITRILTNYTNS